MVILMGQMPEVTAWLGAPVWRQMSWAESQFCLLLPDNLGRPIHPCQGSVSVFRKEKLSFPPGAVMSLKCRDTSAVPSTAPGI